MAEQTYTTDDGEVLYDLTKKTGDRATIDGALLTLEDQTSSAGTGVIASFVRVQATGTEEGYNTDGALVYDEITSDTFTHSLHLRDVPIKTINGVKYFEFRLDINQTNANPLLSLNELKLYTTTNPM